MLVDKQNELMRDLLFTVHQNEFCFKFQNERNLVRTKTLMTLNLNIFYNKTVFSPLGTCKISK